MGGNENGKPDQTSIREGMKEKGISGRQSAVVGAAPGAERFRNR